jgi:predicted CoA-binding protein
MEPALSLHPPIRRLANDFLTLMALILETKRNVAVLGASPKPDRYSNQAVRLLASLDYRPIPVNPAYDEVEGMPCFPRLAEIGEPVHTVTIYLGPSRSTPLIDEILAVNPQRIILNPGTENEELAAAASGAGIEVVEGCTLVMLRTGLF